MRLGRIQKAVLEHAALGRSLRYFPKTVVEMTYVRRVLTAFEDEQLIVRYDSQDDLRYVLTERGELLWKYAKPRAWTSHHLEVKK